ncbi:MULTISPECIES: LysR substrate-binding domain-containing protein [unclassified Pseudomonas]|uniref:LysR substrate-binding domain-containing protein n=1 Tax=unclassified Pseudomonas TaxID=196821 RepID=UPI00131BC0E9|nr:MULTISPECIES: LysR substrate-binding domain-containing protein [unclassified Pseudomonas]
MTRRLASTTALVALEAAARHLSFAKAAQELALSEGAISRQIAKLEAALGVRLFNRVGNRVELSAAGAGYAAHMRTALADIERHTQQLIAQARGATALEIGVIPTLAGRWLIPLLARFRERHPNIEVNLRERTQPFALEDSGLHAAINYEHPSWQNLRVQRLFDAQLVAVCHPRLADHPPASLPLLHKRESPHSWRRYAALTGLALGDQATGPTYDRYSLLIEAANAGFGMALVPQRYIEEDLATGRLQAPWPVLPELRERYVLVTRPAEESDPALASFERWLLEEASLE